ncbi:MAG TPA: hypothetical protein VMH49_01935 [Thermoplasmata archaeon]|nr:hypothetical protein [Thermoplasmata archaeon]
MAQKKVHVLVGTRKGTYIVESDTRRRSWKVQPVSNPGRDIFHVTADPREPGTLYAAVNSGFWGPIVYRASNWGKKWTEVATPMTPVAKSREPMFDPESPAAKARAVINLWRIQPGHPDQPGTVFIGTDPHGLYRSDDRGASWSPIPWVNEHPNRKEWAGGAGGPCLHTILIDPRDPKRMYIGMSAVGTFRSDDAGAHWHPTNTAVETPFQPEKYPETGQCVHHVVLDAENPDVAYRQDHGGMYVNRTGMEGKWERIGHLKGAPADDFGFAVTSPAELSGHAFFVPLGGEARTSLRGGLEVWEWNEQSRKWRSVISPKQFPGEFGVQREGITSDTLDPAGIYVGTTTGQLVVSPDAGKSWKMVPYQFPGIHSVEVAVG